MTAIHTDILHKCYLGLNGLPAIDDKAEEKPCVQTGVLITSWS